MTTTLLHVGAARPDPLAFGLVGGCVVSGQLDRLQHRLAALAALAALAVHVLTQHGAAVADMGHGEARAVERKE